MNNEREIYSNAIGISDEDHERIVSELEKHNEKQAETEQKNDERH